MTRRTRRILVADDERGILAGVIERALADDDLAATARAPLERWLHQLTAGEPIGEAQNVFNIEDGTEHEPRSSIIERVFEHWRATMQKPRARLDTKRRHKIEARLREGYDESELLAAIDGCKASAFHQGDNEHGRRYDDITLICRDGPHVEMFCELAEQPPRARDRSAAGTRQERSREALDAFVRRGGDGER